MSFILHSVRLMLSAPNGKWPNRSMPSIYVVVYDPSIPLDFGIKTTIAFAEKHWQSIDNFGVTMAQFESCLKFICFNYEIKFKDKVFKQRKGCPMGAHFAPPFAIITMSQIEEEALERLKNNGMVPKIYKRYLDDILLGPVKADMVNEILDTFNSIQESIQFTVEVPEENEFLAFLDIAIRIKDQIQYKWYVKPCHSDNSLRYESYVPNHIKTNFVRNSIRSVDKKCSSEYLRTEARKKLDCRLKKNGFKNYGKVREQKRTRQKIDKRSTCLTLDFVNDGLSRKINKIMKKYNFPARVIHKPAKSLAKIFKDKKHKEKHDNCRICDHLPNNFTCEDRFLVYKFTCKYCSHFYIGETSRPFSCRYKEHERSIKQKSLTSALAEHAHEAHNNRSIFITDFDLDILRRCRAPVETRLAEARAITVQRPQLNRKHEKNCI